MILTPGLFCKILAKNYLRPPQYVHKSISSYYRGEEWRKIVNCVYPRRNRVCALRYRDYVARGYSTVTPRSAFCSLFRRKPCNFSPFGSRVRVFCFSRQLRQKVVKQLVNGKQPSLGKQAKFSEIRRLLSLAKPEKWRITGAILFLIVSSSVTMAVPFCLGKVIDIIYTSESGVMKEKLYTLAGILIGVFIIGGLCNFGRVYLMSISGQRITQALRTKVFSSIMKQEVAFFDKNKTGELINRLSADSSLVSQSVTMNISDGLRSSMMVMAGVSMMFYLSPQLALVGLAIVPPMAGMAVVYGRFVKKITQAVQDSLAEATHVAEERIANVRTVKSFSNERREIASYENKTLVVLKLAYKEALARGIFFGMTGLGGNIMILSVLCYGGEMVAKQSLTVGELSSFLLYAAYVGISVAGISSFYSEAMRGIGASTRLWELIDREPMIPLKGGLRPGATPVGCITFNDVWFCYPSRTEPVFRGLNLEVEAGKTYAVVGASGSGKSTLAALLLRLYDPDRGVITLDGVSVANIDPSWLRRHIATVSQEPVLFSGTIRDNILYGIGGSDLESQGVMSEGGGPKHASDTECRVVEAAREANALNFIMDLPEQFDTRVGERGVMLSGGQKQRVAIARAIIKNPKILLLDEATSALDSESEHLVQEALERIMRGRTVLTIAHRLSTICNADLIAVLDDGRIAEKGSYAELLAIKDGLFKKLVKHQSFFEGSSS
ncbi:ATP-binding cassette sub-family B member 10, mitochondrial [Ischnura elegans]|uniref:ATP-binding cassette sub-family B member 10, mitochondrial n=1 Tax=Ischnura elegans TaxID=197161 RepID=UPI001ED8AFEE|nr:ATP-binding cassette sub-family B member 10, mitochondrial [Ischnura elegans]